MNARQLIDDGINQEYRDALRRTNEEVYKLFKSGMSSSDAKLRAIQKTFRDEGIQIDIDDIMFIEPSGSGRPAGSVYGRHSGPPTHQFSGDIGGSSSNYR